MKFSGSSLSSQWRSCDHLWENDKPDQGPMASPFCGEASLPFSSHMRQIVEQLQDQVPCFSLLIFYPQAVK